jgi:hypothetical protein
MAVEPKYQLENKYSYMVGTFRRASTSVYEEASQESSFEDKVQSLFMEAQQHLQNREYNLALSAFRELMSLILLTVHPQIPVDPNQFHLDFPIDLALVDVLSAKSAAVLTSTAVVKYDLPTTIASPISLLPPTVAGRWTDAARIGVQVASFHGKIGQNLVVALARVDVQDWKGALSEYQTALAAAPAGETLIRAALLQDMAVLSEKSGDKDAAVKLAQQTVDTLSNVTQLDAKVLALDTATGIVRRAGNSDLATKFANQATQIRSTTNLNPVIVRAAPPVLTSTAVGRRPYSCTAAPPERQHYLPVPMASGRAGSTSAPSATRPRAAGRSTSRPSVCIRSTLSRAWSTCTDATMHRRSVDS